MATTLLKVGLSVKRLQARHQRELNRELAAIDLSLVQWDALRHLHENPQASLHDLAQLTFQTDQSFGALAGRLIERGLIERVPGPGRAVRHRITRRGEDLRGSGEGMVAAALARSFAALSPEELTCFAGLLMKLLDESPVG